MTSPASSSADLDTQGTLGEPPSVPAALTGLVSALAFIGIIFVSGLLSTTGVPRPTAAPAQTQAYFVGNVAVVEAGALVRLVASVLLVAFCALVAGMLHRTGPRPGGAPWAVLAGGAMAALSGTLSVLFAIALTVVDGTASLATTEGLRQLNFLTGGAGYTVWLGLVVGPMCLVLRRVAALPSWLTAAGLVSATFAFLSALSLVVGPAALFIPLGRFSALLVIAVISVLLAMGRVTAGTYRASGVSTVLGGIGTVVAAILVTVFI